MEFSYAPLQPWRYVAVVGMRSFDIFCAAIFVGLFVNLKAIEFHL